MSKLFKSCLRKDDSENQLRCAQQENEEKMVFIFNFFYVG